MYTCVRAAWVEPTNRSARYPACTAPAAARRIAAYHRRRRARRTLPGVYSTPLARGAGGSALGPTGHIESCTADTETGAAGTTSAKGGLVVSSEWFIPSWRAGVMRCYPSARTPFLWVAGTQVRPCREAIQTRHGADGRLAPAWIGS